MKTGPTLSFLLLLLLGLSQADSLVESMLGDDVQVDDLEDADMDISSLILNANNGSSEMLLEGDVLMPTNRNAMRCRNDYCRWRKVSNVVNVPITVSTRYLPYQKRRIAQSIKEIESRTCIRFPQRTNEVDYISVESRGGCWSSLGRRRGRQVLSLKQFGCVYTGIIIHEFLHALGFYHEQTRSDRDDYVEINWQNIRPGLQSQFRKRSTNNLDTDYDYSSIMHYGREAFTKNGFSTITPIPDRRVKIGQRSGLSEIDILRINRLYNCDEEDDE